MKRELNIVQAAEKFRAGDKIIIHFVGFYTHAGNVRTLAENITVYSGLTYIADDRQPRTVYSFTEALQTAKALMKDYLLNEADKLSTTFFTMTPETDKREPETVSTCKGKYSRLLRDPQNVRKRPRPVQPIRDGDQPRRDRATPRPSRRTTPSFSQFPQRNH